MNKKEFEKLIQFEEIASVSDERKFMYKAYLDCLLRGGKIRKSAFLYALGSNRRNKLMAEAKEEGKALNINDGMPVRNLTELFKKMKKDRFWMTENTKTVYYDNTGEEIFWSDYRPPKQFSIMKEITTKTTYYLDKSLDIRPMELRRNGRK